MFLGFCTIIISTRYLLFFYLFLSPSLTFPCFLIFDIIIRSLSPFPPLLSFFFFLITFLKRFFQMVFCVFLCLFSLPFNWGSSSPSHLATLLQHFFFVIPFHRLHEKFNEEEKAASFYSKYVEQMEDNGG